MQIVSSFSSFAMQYGISNYRLIGGAAVLTAAVGSVALLILGCCTRENPLQKQMLADLKDKDRRIELICSLDQDGKSLELTRCIGKNARALHDLWAGIISTTSYSSASHKAQISGILPQLIHSLTAEQIRLSTTSQKFWEVVDLLPLPFSAHLSLPQLEMIVNSPNFTKDNMLDITQLQACVQLSRTVSQNKVERWGEKIELLEKVMRRMKAWKEDPRNSEHPCRSAVFGNLYNLEIAINPAKLKLAREAKPSSFCQIL